MRTVKLLKMLIYFLFFIIGGLVVFSLIKYSVTGEILNVFSLQKNEILEGLILIIHMVISFCILYNILKVVKNAEAKDFFGYANVKSFKYISIGIWIILVMDIVKNCIDSGTFKIGIEELTVIIIALFVQSISYIFSQAHRLKESEKRLKEENELII